MAKPGPARCVARLRRLAFAPTWVQRATACELVSPRLGFGGRQPEPLWLGNVTSNASFACSGCRSWCKIILRQCRTRPRESRGGGFGCGNMYRRQIRTWRIIAPQVPLHGLPDPVGSRRPALVPSASAGPQTEPRCERCGALLCRLRCLIRFWG